MIRNEIRQDFFSIKNGTYEFMISTAHSPEISTPKLIMPLQRISGSRLVSNILGDCRQPFEISK